MLAQLSNPLIHSSPQICQAANGTNATGGRSPFPGRPKDSLEDFQVWGTSILLGLKKLSSEWQRMADDVELQENELARRGGLKYIHSRWGAN